MLVINDQARIPSAEQIMEKMITMRIRVVIFMPFFPRSLYSTRTVATEIIEGMILSNRSATARLTSPIWNARGVFAVTKMCIRDRYRTARMR